MARVTEPPKLVVQLFDQRKHRVLAELIDNRRRPRATQSMDDNVRIFRMRLATRSFTRSSRRKFSFAHPNAVPADQLPYPTSCVRRNRVAGLNSASPLVQCYVMMSSDQCLPWISFELTSVYLGFPELARSEPTLSVLSAFFVNASSSSIM